MSFQNVPPPPQPSSNEANIPPHTPGRRKIFVVGGAVLLGALALTFVTSRNSSTVTAGASTTTVLSANNSVAVAAENQPVNIVGDALPPQPDTGADKAIGTAAPPVEGHDFSGTGVTIKPGDGKPKVIVFVAHWCPHCQREIPRIVKWIGDGSISKSIEVVVVSTGVKSDAPNFPPSAWLAKENWPGAIIADDKKSTAGQAYGLTGFPFFALVDGAGKVVARDSGEKELGQIQALIAKVAA